MLMKLTINIVYDPEKHYIRLLFLWKPHEHSRRLNSRITKLGKLTNIRKRCSYRGVTNFIKILYNLVQFTQSILFTLHREVVVGFF